MTALPKFIGMTIICAAMASCGPVSNQSSSSSSSSSSSTGSSSGSEPQIRSVPEYFEPLDAGYVQRRRQAACPPQREAAVGTMLENLRQADQRDRQARKITVEQDRIRRAEVAKLFAEGCFRTARDYHNAAIIFQHGETPDHFYQTFIWAQKAVDKGDESATWLIPRAIDRYMLNSGYKQLFGTNIVTVSSYRPNATQEEQKEFCLWPTAKGVGMMTRNRLNAPDVKDRIKRVHELNAQNGISTAGMCKVEVPDPPRGLFPGVW